MQQTMPEWFSRQGRFWRYNYQVLAGTGYWVLAVPIAASQIVTLWMMALAGDFGQNPATRTSELMTPILGAFLVAHSLAPEYRSGVGAVLACKPISLSRVLTMRAGLGMLAALALTLITLSVCSVGLKPVDIWTPLLASVPSLWFLSSLAMVFATIFRNPLGGFAVALALWSLDFALGYGVHPFLSVQGLSAKLSGDFLGGFWLPGKLVQVAAGLALWAAHARLLPRVCRAPERTDVLKIASACALVLAAYCATGAGTVVGYAYFKRGNLPQHDVLWLRRQLQLYGPVPVARLFGPAFTAYIAEPPVKNQSGTMQQVRVAQLKRAAARWPNSAWAEGIAFALGLEQETVDVEASILQYFSVADRFPRSPFAPKALVSILRRREGDVPDAQRLLAARRLLSDYPQRPEAERGAEALGSYYPAQVKPDELRAAAAIAARTGPVYRKPEWLLRQAELEAEVGQAPAALQHAQEALAEARRLQAASNDDSDLAQELRPHLRRFGDAATGAEALITRLGGAK